MMSMLKSTAPGLNITTYCNQLHVSQEFSRVTRSLNVWCTLLVLVIGLFGNSLGIMVFAQKRFRTHSSSIYLLFICITNACFLATHFLEDTVRTLLNFEHDQLIENLNCSSVSTSLSYWTNGSHRMVDQILVEFTYYSRDFLQAIRVIDQSDWACRSINFIRYSVRFTCAYLISSFTIQRTLAIRFPLWIQQHNWRIDSKKFAKYTVTVLIILSMLCCAWVPFTFELRESEESSYCDVNREWRGFYFYITIVYVVLTMLVPIMIVVICNTLLIVYLFLKRNRLDFLQANSKAKQIKSRLNSEDESRSRPDQVEALRTTSEHNISFSTTLKSSLASSSVLIGSSSIKLSRKLATQMTNQVPQLNRGPPTRESRKSESRQITRMLFIMSFTYTCLNIPYFVSWCFFFREVALMSSQDELTTELMFNITQLCEIFYILNYASQFYIYCLSGTQFRKLLVRAIRSIFCFKCYNCSSRSN